MPVKKKDKKVKIRGIRGARAPKKTTKKPSMKQVVNIYTTKAEPIRTNFREQTGYTSVIQPIREQIPIQPIYKQPTPSIITEPKVQIKEPTEKRKYTRRPIVYGVAVGEPLSRQSSGYESEFMQSPTEASKSEFITSPEEISYLERQRKAERKIEEELLRQPSSPEFFMGQETPIVEGSKKKGGRPKGSKNKPKSPFESPPPVGQQDIMQFFGKTGGGLTRE